MKYSFGLIFIHFGLILFAQSNYFIQYAYSSQRDSVKNKRVVSEMVNLYTSPTKTLYVANNRLVTDSLYQEIDQEKEMAAIMESKVLNVADLKKKYPSTRLNYYVWDTFDEPSVKFFVSLGGNGYLFEYSKEPLDWTIGSETKEIAGYLAKKASLFFLGKQWTAWYTEEIPLQHGPFVFNGLPGLILSLTDERKDFNWEIKRIATVDTSLLDAYESIYKATSRELKSKFIDVDSLKKALRSYHVNRIAITEQMGLSFDEETTQRIRQRQQKAKPLFLHPAFDFFF